METKLDKLKRYIRTNYETQDQFAKAIGLTRQGVAYVLRTSKSNNGELTADFLMRLEHHKINIFKNEPENKRDKAPPEKIEDPDVQDWKMEVIQTQKQTILTQKQLIENLTARLQQYESDMGKAGAR